MAPASQVREFLTTVGAKQINLYTRTGRQPRLVFKYRDKSFGIEIDQADIETGAAVIPKLREAINSAFPKGARYGEPIRAMRDQSTSGARLKIAREEATLKRDILAQSAKVELSIIRWLETNKAPLEDHLTEDQIAALARECRVDVDWLMGRQPPPAPVAVEPPPPAPEPPPPLAIEPVKRRRGRAATANGGVDYAGIGARIKLVRQNRGWNQKKLGDVLYYSPTVIVNAEKGRRNGLFDRLEEVAGCLHCSAHWLITGEETPAPPPNLDLDQAAVEPEAPPLPPPVQQPVSPPIEPPPASADVSISAATLREIVRRLDQLELKTMARQEEILANQALTLRYLKVLHKRTMPLAAPVVPAKKPKNPKKVAAMQAAWRRRKGLSELIEPVDSSHLDMAAED